MAAPRLSGGERTQLRGATVHTGPVLGTHALCEVASASRAKRQVRHRVTRWRRLAEALSDASVRAEAFQAVASSIDARQLEAHYAVAVSRA